MLFMKLGCAIFAKNGGGGVQFYANNGKLPVDRGDAVMIQLVTSKERNLSRLWDSSGSKRCIQAPSSGEQRLGPSVDIRCENRKR